MLGGLVLIGLKVRNGQHRRP
ncbi:hypothetical protein LXT12_25685 [Pelomonas sp. P7]|uniref:Uncharacterized protein n=2 Tax=Roseateles TaxID=93681 RepID=A0ABS8XIG2_9BURK|nr:hypothetical protein [Pelomonas sp. P7]